MAAMFILLLGLSMLSSQMKGTQSIGVCYGRNGDNLPPASEVIDLYKSNVIAQMRIYDPDQSVLQALKGSNIDLILDVPKDKLQSLASNPSVAADWVQTNVKSFSPDVKFKYIAVGNEIKPSDAESKYVLPAMQNVHNAIASAGLQDQIKVSTAIEFGLLGTSYPPSDGSFKDDAKTYINPIITFLASNGSPLLANVYPYISYIGDPQNIQLQYALFTAPGVVVHDPNSNLDYRNLFDALMDALYSALEKSNGANVEIVVSESGWPSAGEAAATTENAGTYNKNLIDHVKGSGGTPKKPGRAIQTYLFAMFDENKKPGAPTEQHFGLFSPDKQPKYQISFN
ncbi:glucan endo-1,3-beta-glucosidase-like [Malania oleifera]|uniref:glucan endo-1,3-beta-glucosidase-like n=1 Tax=Malania oleifera TaxID=397392 RepID=UPI0025ADF34D|nr:glucan endo-1,3-beta-glucosidase-like [Malania oleifera]